MLGVPTKYREQLQSTFRTAPLVTKRIMRWRKLKVPLEPEWSCIIFIHSTALYNSRHTGPTRSVTEVRSWTMNSTGMTTRHL